MPSQEELDAYIATPRGLQMLENIIDERIRKLKLEVPEANRKNAYTRACYLLSFLQKTGAEKLMGNPHRATLLRQEGFSPILADVITEDIKFLREVLPTLKKKYS